MATTTKFLADLTKCYPGAFPSVLAGVLDLAKAHGLEGSDLIFVVHGDQRIPTEVCAEKRMVSGTSYNAWFFALPVVKGIIKELAGQGVRSLILGSFYADVLRLKQDPPEGMQITEVFFGTLRGDREMRLRPNLPCKDVAQQWSFGSFVSREDAQKACLIALFENDCISAKSAAWLTNVKPMMADADKRFVGSAISTNTSGMMSQLSASMEMEGLIHTDATVKVNNKLVWLSPKGIEVATALVKDRARVAESARSDTLSVQKTAADPIDTGSVSVGPDADRSSPPAGEVPAIGRPEVSAIGREARKGSVLSIKFEDALRSQNLGPFATYLRPMLSALADVPLDGGVKLRDMVKNAVVGASDLVRKRGLDPDCPEHAAPWRRIKEFGIKVLPLAGAVYTDGDQQIHKSAKAGQMIVRRLDPAYPILVYAELLFGVISTTPDVNDSNKTDLAFVLFHKAEDDEIGLIEQALGRLIDDGRIEEDPRQGNVYYKVKAVAGQTSMRIGDPISESA